MNKLITISSALLTAAAVKAQTPNIVFILADDLGYGDISAFNPESKIHTPNIDKLAEHGIAFTDAHASSALSTPSSPNAICQYKQYYIHWQKTSVRLCNVQDQSLQANRHQDHLVSARFATDIFRSEENIWKEWIKRKKHGHP